MLAIYAYMISLINVLVSAGRNESWLYTVGADEVVVCNTRSLHCRKRDEKAQDGQALLAFVVSQYDRLDSLRIAFVHGGENEWHSTQNIREIIKAEWNARGFTHLGKVSNRKCIGIQGTGWCSNILEPQNVTCDLHICTYQGLQFVSDGDAFRKSATIQQYQGMEKTCNGLDSPPREFGKAYKGCSFAMEYLAQFFAGGPLILPSEHRTEL